MFYYLGSVVRGARETRGEMLGCYCVLGSFSNKPFYHINKALLITAITYSNSPSAYYSNKPQVYYSNKPSVYYSNKCMLFYAAAGGFVALRLNAFYVFDTPDIHKSRIDMWPSSRNTGSSFSYENVGWPGGDFTYVLEQTSS